MGVAARQVEKGRGLVLEGSLSEQPWQRCRSGLAHENYVTNDAVVHVQAALSASIDAAFKLLPMVMHPARHDQTRVISQNLADLSSLNSKCRAVLTMSSPCSGVSLFFLTAASVLQLRRLHLHLDSAVATAHRLWLGATLHLTEPANQSTWMLSSTLCYLSVMTNR